MFVCPPEPWKVLPRGAILAVGCGVVCVTRNNATVWIGDDEKMNLRPFTRIARRDAAEAVWRVKFVGSLQGTVYQFDRKAGWLLVKRGPGFA
jgi:hypothetical protein